MAKKKDGIVDRIMHPGKHAEPQGELQDPPAELQSEPAPAEEVAKALSPSRSAKAAKDYSNHPKFSKFQKGK